MSKSKYIKPTFAGTKLSWLMVGIALFTIVMMLPVPEAIGADGMRVIAVVCLMLTWWVSEAVPIPVTALLPIVLFPILGVLPIKQATASYGHPIVFLFFGGFVIAIAMEKWKLHLRIAISILRMTGTHVSGIVGGFMISTAFLSMWMSNTATTVMMLPIALSVLDLMTKDKKATKGQHNFALSLMMGVAFAANIGGVGTIIGTPPNAIFAGFISDTFNYQIDFAKWMMVGVPFVLIMLTLCWLVLTKLVFYSDLGHIEGADKVIEDQWKKLGKMDKGEKYVLVIFISTALMWMFRKHLGIAGLTDTGIAMISAILMFTIPYNIKKGEFLLNWNDMQRMPWGILLLFGGGLSLASAMSQSGLVQIIGTEVAGFSGYGMLAVVAMVTFVVLMFTECMSNLALITIFLPVLAGISAQLGQNPLLFAIPATMAASCAFMLPMATPPNAIVFASGHIKVSEMVKAGIVMNLLSILLIVIFAYTVVSYVFAIEIGVVPDWAVK